MLPSQAAMIFSMAFSICLEAILNPPCVPARLQYLGRIGAKFWALRELLVASWNFHTFKSLRRNTRKMLRAIWSRRCKISLALPSFRTGAHARYYRGLCVLRGVVP